MVIRPIAARLFLAAALLAVAAPVAAHPLSVSYSHWTVAGRAVRAAVRLPLDDMDLLLRLDHDLDGTVSDAEIQGARDGIAQYVTDRVRVAVDGIVLAPSAPRVARWRDQKGVPYTEAELTFAAARPIDTVTVQVRVLTDLYAGHRNLAEIVEGDRRLEFVFQHASTCTVRRGVGSRWQTARSFLWLGIEHIFTGDPEKRKFLDDGAAFHQALDDAPTGPRAVDATFKGIEGAFFRSSGKQLTEVLDAAQRKEAFLRQYPRDTHSVEVHLMLAIDDRDLSRLYDEAHDRAARDRFREQARSRMRLIARTYPGAEQAKVASEMLKRFEEEIRR